MRGAYLARVHRSGVGRRYVLKRRGGRFGARRRVVASSRELLEAGGHDPRLATLFADAASVGEAAEPHAFPAPDPDEPEVAVAGRSNVGKSSLLAALSVRRISVRAADRPGTTTALAWYRMGSARGKRCRVVDLPGYGFAYAPEGVRQRWAHAMDAYFRTRTVLRRVLVLLDARHGLKAADEGLLRRLAACQVRYQPVLTKADLVEPGDLADTAAALEERLDAEFPGRAGPVLMVNSLERAGVPDVWAEIARATGRTPPERTPEEVAEEEEAAKAAAAEAEAAEAEAAKKKGKGGKKEENGEEGGDEKEQVSDEERRRRATVALFGRADGHRRGQMRPMSDKRRRRMRKRIEKARQ